jgi:hypothetical protein
MKSHKALSIFIILVIIYSFLCSHSKYRLKAKNDKPLRGYYYIQRFYPGNDAIDSIKESEFHTQLMFFEVNKNVIYFAKSLQKIKDIEGLFILKIRFHYG